MNKPFLSIIICTYNRAVYLNQVLESLGIQTLDKNMFEIIVIDSSTTDDIKTIVASFHSVIPLRYFYQKNAGLASARRLGTYVSHGKILLFLDDDDIATPTLLEEHIKTHNEYPEENYAVLHYTTWAPDLFVTHLMHFITEIGCFLFSYPHIRHGQILDYTYFWGGRSSCKRSFLIKHGVFNQVFRFGCEDIELGYRLSKHGLKVVYNNKAVGQMIRPITFDDFCRRLVKQGRSQYIFGTIHGDIEIQKWAELIDADDIWNKNKNIFDAKIRSTKELDKIANTMITNKLEFNDLTKRLLYDAYWWAFKACKIKGIMEAKQEENMRRDNQIKGLETDIQEKNAKIIEHNNTISSNLRSAYKILHEEGLRNLIIRSINFMIYGRGVLNKREILNQICNNNFSESAYDLKSIDYNFKPKVTIIVPNYNHEKFLRQRLDSIFSQTYHNYEVILLDDNSSDNSREILIEYANKYKENTKYIFNGSNSGSIFNQWKTGIEKANGELIWIAESDDYCTDNFISSLIPFFSDESVMIAYCRTIFEKDGTKIWDIESYLADIDQNKWKSDFIETAHRIVNHSMAKKNIIPNVSSAMFRNPGKMSLLDDEKWRSLHFCGDWVFYLYIMRGGAVAYTTNATNYFRQHENNTSTKLQADDIYYVEHEYVAMKIAELYTVSSEVFDDQKKLLQDYWKLRRKSYNEDAFDSCYNIKKIRGYQKCRKPNIAMFGYAFIAGGGETFPIMLANLLHENGYGVTFVDCNREVRIEGFRKMLKQSIPVIKLADPSKMAPFINSLGIDILHSHHGWVDSSINQMIEHMPCCSHMVTMHGMYEMLEDTRLEYILPVLENTRLEDILHKLYTGVDQWVYITDKNIEPFKRFNSYNENKFVKIDNALIRSDINMISRKALDIDKDAFVLCLVSRAIPEKGWEEAISCVGNARSQSGRDIQLIVIGDGKEKIRLQNKAPSYVKFLGFVSNTCDYYAMSDMGFLPSRFKGESFPLTIIECLFAGKPVIVSNIGEINKMLRTEDGKYAGALFDLNNWTIPEKELTTLIIKCATDTTFYNSMLAEVNNVASRFDIKNVFSKYCACYDRLFKLHDSKTGSRR